MGILALVSIREFIEIRRRHNFANKIQSSHTLKDTEHGPGLRKTPEIRKEFKLGSSFQPDHAPSSLRLYKETLRP